MQQIISGLTAGELLILLVTGPLFLFIRPSFVLVLGLVPLLWLARRHRFGRFVPRTPTDWSILGILVMVLASTWATPDLLFSLGKITGVLYGVAIFYALVQLGQQRQSVLLASAIVIALGTAAALLSLPSTQWVVKWSFTRMLIASLPQAIVSVPGYESGFNPNQVSGALIMFPPLQIALLAWLLKAPSIPRARRLWAMLGLCLSLALVGGIILLAQTRAAWAALALGLVCMTAILVKPLRPIFLVLVVAGTIILVVLGPVGVDKWLVQQQWMTDTGEVSWQGRLELWSRGLWAIADFPLTGTGMNMFRRTIWQYPVFHFPPGKDIGHSHQTYIQVALDLGLPGLVSYLALLGGALYAGWRAVRRCTEPMTQLLTLGGLTGLAIHALWGFTDAVALGAKQGFLWWAVLALVITAVVVEQQKHKQAAMHPLNEPAPSTPGQAVEEGRA